VAPTAPFSLRRAGRPGWRRPDAGAPAGSGDLAAERDKIRVPARL